MTPLFEVSWEVCNKVGGIYTVITSKADVVKEKVNEYFFIGPYLPAKKNTDFEEKETPENFKKIFENMKNKKVRCYFGSWIAISTPTILVDFSELITEKNRIKTDLWMEYKIDSLYSGADFEEPVIWATAVGMLLEEISKVWNKKILAQFHEWLSGAGILYLKKRKSNVATVFTTHATVLERAMAGSGESLKEGINADEEARKRNTVDKHLMEKQSALNADIFTAVSQTVSDSCEKIFKRKPEVILINGIDTTNFPNMEEIPHWHRKNKEKIREFVMAYFFPYYYFDVENTLFYFMSGRYEFRGKGIDVFIKALGKLNEELNKEGSDKSIVVILSVPAAVGEEDFKIVESKIFLDNIKEKINEYSENIKKQILYSSVSGNPITECIDDKFMRELKKMIKMFKKDGNPPLTTHTLLNPESDAILQELKKQKLENKKEDAVKIIYYPTYLSANDEMLNLDYYNFIWGCHLGVFPSFYEPWGYTPVESAAYGVPSITTDLSGFGKYVEAELGAGNREDRGIIVLKREGKSDEEVIMQLKEYMKWYLYLPKEKRIKNKMVAETFVQNLSWKILIKNYLQAYKLALEKVK